MSKLAEELCRILDFKYPSQLSIAYTEAMDKEKLYGTFMRVNGELARVTKMYPETNTIRIEDKEGLLRDVDVESLDVFLPETGLYSANGEALYLQKFPYKQWKKSMHQKFYKFFPLTGIKGSELAFLDKAKQVPFFAVGGHIYKNNSRIAKLIEDKVTLLDYNMYQDVLDWITQEKLPWTLQ